jgi:hypothetical protein
VNTSVAASQDILFVIDKPKRADTEAYWASSVIGREGEMPVIRELPIVERLKKS